MAHRDMAAATIFSGTGSVAAAIAVKEYLEKNGERGNRDLLWLSGRGRRIRKELYGETACLINLDLR